ncbi:pre-mRNA 3'-end-processing factor FIP1 [Trichogramma pretiosum]|uniref:pre-mRNA 3'-end-processing factor FIP1 n=1 Tax=Trichogramma pretiosum TaxID=7493 RepID=UPI0006C96F22|nr:pre-mRNA 3'-end-processing factor FIP1 [Trichogramma pretiosum]
MADENEDQWLYGDAVDPKDPPNSNNELSDNNESKYNNDDASYQQSEDARDDLNDEQQMQQLRELQQLEAMGQSDNCQDIEPFDEDDSNTQQPLPSQDEDSMTNDAKLNGTSEKIKRESRDNSNTETDDDDDDVDVVIGDIKSTPPQASQQYNSLNIKRGLLTTSTTAQEKLKQQQSGKFSIDEFETIGSINGIPAHEFNLDTLEDKPWRQPGADITDYFNYGFNEETWRAYCERQKRMRSESGAGLILNTGTGAPPENSVAPGGARVPQVTITNYNSKYSGISGPKRAGPPPGRKMAGTIDVIGSTGLGSRRNSEKSPPKENVIQVMTADRREYSRKPPVFPDVSVPPPVPNPIPPAFNMPPPGFPHPEPVPSYFLPEPDPYYNSYEPTQDRQWGNDPTWQPSNINIPLTGDEMKDSRKSLSMRDRDRERERIRGRDDRERDYDEIRERERDREREREKDPRRDEREIESVTREDERNRSRSQYRHKESRHRHRSRSRSRRHKSRSKSPSRRKKKSRRSERERSKEESD